MAWHVDLAYGSYEEAEERFEWDVPDGYNAAYDLVRKHDSPGRTALVYAFPDGRSDSFTFAELDQLSNRLAHGLRDLGVERGDRVAVIVPQKPANPLAHLACWKSGAISVPLSVLFGTDGLAYRLDHSDARVAVADASIRTTLDAAAADCPTLEHVIEVDGDRTDDSGDGDREDDGDGHGDDGSDADDGRTDDERGGSDAAVTTHTFEAVLADRPDEFEIAETDVDTPALILYTSGSTGPPKGALHTHGLWLGHCPGFRMYFECTERAPDGVFFTPADWAWIGALGDVLFSAWHYGQSVVCHPMGGFDAEHAYRLVADFGVTHAFLPPTAIRMMMTVDDPVERYDVALEVVASGGEPLTPEIVTWADELGITINEFYGQTEANLLVSNCQEWFSLRPGSMGKPVPGHEVAVIDDEGETLPPGTVGHIAVRRDDDPVLFREYWREPERTTAVCVGDWHVTGDLGYRDEEGYVRFKARGDDLIVTSGYRVGPGEIESTILEHPAVEQVGVIGVPDETRGELIKAFVQPGSRAEGSDALRAEIRDLVRERLAAHEYPREIEFVTELPRTTTGKIRRTDLRERDR